MTNVTFREATAADVAAIARLHAESWSRNYRGIFRDDYLEHSVADDRRGIWHQRLVDQPDPRRFVLLAERDSALVGFICAYGDEHPHLGSLIDNLHVASEHQRSGIGRKLMRQSGEWLAERYPRSRVYLDVLERNAGAISFYAALGGRREGPIMTTAADGSRVSSYQYIWESPPALVEAADDQSGETR